MGCWNETCAITQMPIQSGDPVALVFLTKVDRNAENHGGFCYSNAIWTPKFLPVFGAYDDYGGLEQIEENWNTSFIVDQLKSELSAVRLTNPFTSTTQDTDDLHVEHEDLNLDSFTVYDVLEQIHADRVWVPGVTHKLPVGWCMMHRWVWDHMTQVMERDWRDNISLETVKAHGEAYYQAMLNKHVQARGHAEDSAYRAILKYDRRDLVEWDNTFAVFADSGSQLDSYGTISGIRTYDDLLWQMAERHTDVQAPLVQGLIHALSEFLVFRNNMTVLRKFWSPQTGKGSQITSHESHLALHKLCVEKLQERMKEWAEEDEAV